MIRKTLTRSIFMTVLFCTANAHAQIPEAQVPAALPNEPAPKSDIAKNMFLSQDALNAAVNPRGGEPTLSAEEQKRNALAEALNNLNVPESNQPFTPSYGDMNTSVVFGDGDITLMKGALDRIERILASGGEISAPVVEARVDPSTGEPAPVVPQTVPDLNFPVYHVASIVYRSPRDWMVWVNGNRITPKRNNGEMRVVGVRPDQVQLSWKPDNWQYRTQVWQDKQPLSPEMRKIQSRQASSFVNMQSETLGAVMRQNQTWVTATPIIVEGKHPELEVTIKPEMKSADQTAEGAAGVVPSFSSKAAQEYMSDAVKQTAQKINKKSEEIVKETLEKPQPAVPQQVEQTGQLATQPPPAPAAPAAPPVAPSSLNDILSAISNAPPPAQEAAPLR